MLNYEKLGLLDTVCCQLCITLDNGLFQHPAIGH